MRCAIVAVLIGGGTWATAAEPAKVPPRTVTLGPADRTLGTAVAEVAHQFGVPVSVSDRVANRPVAVTADDVPAWQVLDRLAKATGTRVTVDGRGAGIALEPHTGPPVPSSVDGPFRIAVNRVESRLDFDTGTHVTDVTLDVHWEPRFPVIRLDAGPTITAITDDVGSELAVPTAAFKAAPVGYRHTATVRVRGVPRKATKLTRLAGSFTVTAAPGVLPFAFADLSSPAAGTLPKGVDAGGVSAKLVRFEEIGDRWEVEVSATYPEGHPEFESFESWTAGNRAVLSGPAGAMIVESSDSEINERGRTATGIYRFRASDVPADARLVYETPAALLEYRADVRVE